MKPLIVGNWKMNPIALAKAQALFSAVKRGVQSVRKAEVVVCPPFVYLPACRGTGVKLGSQDCFWEDKGAYTGAISLSMLKDLGCKYVIVGHSERRKIFGETDGIVNKKLKAVIESGLTPILCIGETGEERKQGRTQAVLKKQIKFALKDVSSSRFRASGLCIAYEPIWAIGTGTPCSPEEAQRVALLIKKIAANKTVSVLYGGSVKSDNVAGFIAAGLDGVLVGGASLKAHEFIKIAKIAGNS